MLKRLYSNQRKTELYTVNSLQKLDIQGGIIIIPSDSLREVVFKINYLHNIHITHSQKFIT